MVYPRVCGGTQVGRVVTLTGGGLSPRVRGNPDGRKVRHRRRGSIPACAGEPSVCATAGLRRKVYPRVCGGTRLPRQPSEVPYGLSPRVRGNRRFLIRRYRRLRSIPACAGEPCPPGRRSARRGVYPRVCGGTLASARSACSVAGLSPRVRGNLSLGTQHVPAIGSIPACAGEPPWWTCFAATKRVYPRVCGGTYASGNALAILQGLSPRVRGNHLGKQRLHVTVRSIPACAGEPGCRASRVRCRTVYPRVCGGTSWMRCCAAAYSGLSPRVRGNRRFLIRRYRRLRSIPACAGEPPCQQAQTGGHAVYPRVCGGTHT